MSPSFPPSCSVILSMPPSSRAYSAQISLIRSSTARRRINEWPTTTSDDSVVATLYGFFLRRELNAFVDVPTRAPPIRVKLKP